MKKELRNKTISKLIKSSKLNHHVQQLKGDFGIKIMLNIFKKRRTDSLATRLPTYRGTHEDATGSKRLEIKVHAS